jgi:hypothetical protein
MVKEAAGRRGIVTNPNLLEIVGRSDGGAKARFPLRRGSGKWIPCRPFGVLGWGAARQSVLATLGARPESGEYALPGITAEWLEDDEATEEAFPA